ALAQITGRADARHLYEGAYKWGIFPCMLAAGFFGLWLGRVWMRRERPMRFGPALLVGLCMLNPPAIRALQYGHPEEILGAVLCAGAVVAAIEGRPRIAVLLAALAIANKQWGIFVLVPVALAVPPQHMKR